MEFSLSSRFTVLISVYAALWFSETTMAAGAQGALQGYPMRVFLPQEVPLYNSDGEYNTIDALKKPARGAQAHEGGRSKTPLILGGVLMALIVLGGFGIYRAKDSLKVKAFESDVKQLLQAMREMEHLTVEWQKIHVPDFDPLAFELQSQNCLKMAKDEDLKQFEPSTGEAELISKDIAAMLIEGNNSFIMKHAQLGFGDMKCLAETYLPELRDSLVSYDIKLADTDFVFDEKRARAEVDKLKATIPTISKKLYFFLDNGEKLAAAIRAQRLIRARLEAYLSELYGKNIVLYGE